jgi:transposase
MERPSAQTLAAVRALNRLDVVGEMMRHALNTLAVATPEWLRAVSPPGRRGRDARRAEDDRLPTTQAVRAALTRTIGHDGWPLLAAIDHPEAPPWLRTVPAIATLRRVWMQNPWWDGTQLRWREAGTIPPAAQCISSPYDPAAHAASKLTPHWVDSKGHTTETCEDDLPHLVTHVDTTIGPAAGGAVTPKSHAALQPRGLLPGAPIVDTGSLDADLLGKSPDDYGVDLLGPTRLDYHWQARQGAGFTAQHFQIDWDRQHAIRASGKAGISWTPAVDHRGNAVIKVECATKDCRPCPTLTRCVRPQKRDPRRTGTIRPRPPYHAVHAARRREAADVFQAEYARRAGVEGTISRGVRGPRPRRTRDIGVARVRLEHLLTEVGLNVLRLGERFLETSHAKTRLPPFARLMADAPAA